MGQVPQRTLLPKTPSVRFPLRADRGHRPRLSRLLPRRWRRQVVIHGQRFRLPG